MSHGFALILLWADVWYLLNVVDGMLSDFVGNFYVLSAGR